MSFKLFFIIVQISLILGCSDGNPVKPTEVFLASLSDGDWVEGSTSISVSAAGGNYTYVELKVDGQTIKTEFKDDTQEIATYTFFWQPANANQWRPINYVVEAEAFGSSGSIRKSPPVTVTALFPRQLTDNPGVDIQPEWSKDGTKIIFKSNRLSPDPVQSFKIYTMNADGTQQEQIFTDKNYHGYPDWSPDETHVIFNSFDPGNNELFTASIATGQSSQITTDSGFDDSGRWSPDGTQIAFFSTRTGGSELYLLPVDNNGVRTGFPTRITSNSNRDEQPRWSPDGQKLIYESDRSGPINIWMIDLATKMETQITVGTSVDDGYPNWSPDGTFLVFDSKRSENRDLYLCPSSGGEEKRVTFNPSYDDHGSWSPDLTKIVFGSNRAGNMDIWVVEIPSI